MSEKLKHWLRITRKGASIIAELEQLIRDTNYWNGLPHNQQYTPIDLEQDRVMLAKLKKAHAEFIEKNPRPTS